MALNRALWRIALDPMALGVAGVAGAAGIALHSVPVVSVGILAYGALVAWEILGKAPDKPERKLPEPVVLPAPASFADQGVQQAIISLAESQTALWATVREAPDNVLACVLPALAAVRELTTHALGLAARAEELNDFLKTQDRRKLKGDLDRLALAAREATDPGARAEYGKAVANRTEQIGAVEEIAAAHDRAIAALAKVVTTLDALPAKIVRMKALDHAALDALGDDLTTDVHRLNQDIQLFENTLRSLAHLPS